MHIFICFKCINIRDVIIYIAASNAWLFERSGLCDRLELIISISKTMCTYWPYRRVGRYRQYECGGATWMCTVFGVHGIKSVEQRSAVWKIVFFQVFVSAGTEKTLAVIYRCFIKRTLRIVLVKNSSFSQQKSERRNAVTRDERENKILFSILFGNGKA